MLLLCFVFLLGKGYINEGYLFFYPNFDISDIFEKCEKEEMLKSFRFNKKSNKTKLKILQYLFKFWEVGKVEIFSAARHKCDIKEGLVSYLIG